MATTAVDSFPNGLGPPRLNDPVRVRSFLWMSSITLVALICWLVAREWPQVVSTDLVEASVWVVAALVSDLMLVRVGKGITLSMSIPITLAAAMLFAPALAALIAFLGCLDPMELRRESSLSRIVFNRSQVAVATAAAALAFRAVHGNPRAWPLVIAASLVALVADFLVNAAFVVPTVALKSEITLLAAFRCLFGSAPSEAILLYISMALVAPLLAVVYIGTGGWGLAAFLVPIALARAALVRAERLHVASGRLAAKDEAIRRTADSVGEERRDERMALAGELHDSVIPALFKVHLMGQVIKEDLDGGRLLELDADLPELLSATEVAQGAVREVVSELRSSPIGPGGLSGTVRQLARHLEANGAPPLVLSLEDFRAAPATNLVLYQAAREAMLNASLYAKSGVIRVHLKAEGREARLIVADEGLGFDTATVDQRNHFGLQFMRERIEALGGRLVIDSQLGKGTVVAVSVPLGESAERRLA